jgi:hypothetical protein
MVELLLLSRPLLPDQRFDQAWIFLMLQELPDLDRSRTSVGALAHVIVRLCCSHSVQIIKRVILPFGHGRLAFAACLRVFTLLANRADWLQKWRLIPSAPSAASSVAVGVLYVDLPHGIHIADRSASRLRLLTCVGWFHSDRDLLAGLHTILLALDWLAHSRALAVPFVDELELESTCVLVYSVVSRIAATCVGLTGKGSELLKLCVLVLRPRPFARK